MPLSVPLLVSRTSPETRAVATHPLRAGIPLPKGALGELGAARLVSRGGTLLPLDVSVSERWPDGSVRWALIDTVVDVPEGEDRLALSLEFGLDGATPSDRVDVRRQGDDWLVDTGVARFTLSPRAPGVIARCESSTGVLIDRSQLTIRGASGSPWPVVWKTPVVDARGPLRALVSVDGTASDGAGHSVSLRLGLEFHAGQSTVRVLLTVRNPRPAAHPGGIWELGDGGSVELKELSLSVGLPGQAEALIRWSAEPASAEQSRTNVTIYQDSSGGENWSSSNHVTRHGHVATRFRGYAVDADGTRHTGHRAQPVVAIDRASSRVAAAVPAFWQNFPRAIVATPSELTISFFPSESADAHELQGGEQKTHECVLFAGASGAADADLAVWHARPVLHATPDWYVSAHVVPFLSLASDDAPGYRALVNAAIDGVDTFIHKREVADEYGWRHFGDIYGDHEGVFHKGPTPLMSHYNNQYDPVAGMLYQFMRTGDPRWWTQCLELASHVIDIDIYHTDDDKAAYNHGLFWHTYHYVDSARANHRTYPTGTIGGGPSSEQNYPTGLMLLHLVTGDTAPREAALGLAQFVIDMDDGARTVFRWLDGGDTGIASASRTPDYQGPGRGSANSLNALVDGHRMSGDRRFLEKAEQIIRRVTHPEQNLERLQLLDAENRWFYTMYLQSLAKYLDWKADIGELDAMYAYGRDVLLHFARWMASNERPYLDRPDLLEYPTETWPAQDVRKSEIFDAAARHATGEERARLLERAEFFYRYVVDALSEMPTRSLARPVVLLLVHGHRRAHTKRYGVQPAPTTTARWQDRWPAHDTFVPQKARAIRRAKALVGLAGVAGVSGIAAAAWWFLR